MQKKYKIECTICRYGWEWNGEGDSYWATYKTYKTIHSMLKALTQLRSNEKKTEAWLEVEKDGKMIKVKIVTLYRPAHLNRI